MKFIHFGCWNEGYCDMKNTSINGLSSVMALLRRTVDEDKTIDFISIAGDNYYGTKVSNPVDHIVFDTVKFESGFHCLPKDIMKYIILGNHEIEKHIIMDGSEVNCGNLKKQVELTHNDPNIIFFNETMSLYNDNTLVLFIDSTIYSMIHQDIKNTCYKMVNIKGDITFEYKVFKDSTINEDEPISKLIEYMNDKIIKIIKDTILTKGDDFKNLILIGHEPIYAMKNKLDKKGNTINKVSSVMPLIIFFNTVLIPILVAHSIKTYYMCADVHIYQHGIITFSNSNYKVEQYIVGTGGAHQDMVSTILYEGMENTMNQLEYKIIEQSDKFGFMIVNIINSVITTEYLPIPNTDIESYNNKYYFNKYTKYKMKYLALKTKYKY